MNHIYRVIFNQETGTFQAVSEIVRTSRKSHSSKGGHLPKILLTPLSVAVTLLSSQAFASPTGGQVTAGVANIAQTGTITNINQSSQNAAINWQSFNVGKNETVNFNQPNAQSVTLNRVIGNERSIIDGAMNASGKVFISNANGMLIGKDAKINVGSLVATTANISDDDLMNGRYQFTGEGAGNIENLGHISVPKGGVVALVAPIVKNGGTITAHDGNVLLASAESFSITLPDNANFAYTLDKGTLQGLVDNGGAILADAGRVVLTAKGVDTVKKSLIKHTGKIEANTVQNKNGVIELLGDLDNSALNVSGSLKAEGKASDDGGFIETSAAQLNFDDNAVISTKSETGQTGTWLIDPKDFTVAPSGGDITGTKVSEGLQSNNVTLKSRDGAKEGKGDVIINDEISWDKNTLTLNAESDIHINKTLNGTGTAKLALEYGGDYHLQKDIAPKNRTVKVNLPEGRNFSTNGTKFTVIHQMPSNGSLDEKVAFGSDMDLSSFSNKQGFNGFAMYYHNDIHGLGHILSNLNINSSQDSTGFFSGIGHTDSLRDFSLNNISINSTGNNIGILSGWSAGIVKNIVVINSNITGVKNVGGLIGANLDDVYLGMPPKGIVDNVYVQADVISNDFMVTSSGTGGIIGNSKKTILSNAEFKGTVNGQTNVGGLIGSSSDTIVRSSFSDASVHSGNFSGGLIGINTYGKNEISNSASVGKVTSSANSAGGLVGSSGGLAHLTINNSYSLSDVKSHKNIVDYININNGSKTVGVGGIIGESRGGNVVLSNVYSAGKIESTNKKIPTGGLIGYSQDPVATTNSFFDKTKIDQAKAIGNGDKDTINGKYTEEMKQKPTFKDWDFEKVWYMNEGSMPKLRAFATSLAVTPSTPTLNAPTDKAQAGVKAPDLSKTYDGKTITSVDDLKKLNGWKDNFDADGLTTGDSVESIFKTGTLTIDETKGDWKGAKDVKEGGYELHPTGTLKDEYQQKYIIEWNKGTLTINPAKLTITAMNNIKPEGENNPDVSRIGVTVQGLVDGESISDVNLSYSDDKKWQGDISIIRVGEPAFSNGKASNYEITKNHGKLLTVQREYDLNDITNKKPEDVAKIRDLLNAVEDEMLLAHAVYGSDSAKKGDNDRFYEIWEVKDNQTGEIHKEMKPLNYTPPTSNGKTYKKLYELIANEDHSSGIVNAIDRGALHNEQLLTKAEYDKLVASGEFFYLERTYRDGFYPTDTVRDENPDMTNDFNGLAVGIYKNTENNKHYIVFRGTDTTGTNHVDLKNMGGGKNNLDWASNIHVVDPIGTDDYADSDGGTNSEQGLGNLPPQYQRARALTKEFLEQYPNLDWTIIGHSLGGGLASYSSLHQDKMIPTITFNQAQIHYKNLPKEYADMWLTHYNKHYNDSFINNNGPEVESEASNLVVTEMRNRFHNIHSIVLDNDILSKARMPGTVYPSGIYHSTLLPHIGGSFIDNTTNDHLMPHAIKTQRLVDIMAKNNEISANCQKGCVKIQEHQWTPPAQLKEIDTNRPTKYQKERDNIQRDIAERERKGKDTEKQRNNLNKVTQKLEQAEVTSGKITVLRGNDSWEVGKNGFLDFKFGDVISTENKKATIYFPDGSWIELDKNSSIRIEIDTTSKRPMADQISLIKGKILRKGNKKPE